MSILEDDRVAALVSVQAQAISRQQLRQLGFTDHQITWAIGRVLRHAARGVFVVRGSPDSWEQRLWVKRLTLGGVPSAIADEAAAAVHRFESYRPGPATFVVPHGWHRRVEGVRQSRDPWMESTELFGNIPVTSPAQTICDLAARASLPRLRDVVDDAFSRRIVRPTAMIDAFDDLRRKGKPGFKKLATILDDWRDDGKVPTRSKLERKTLGLFDTFGGPKPLVAWPYPTRRPQPDIADFGFVDALLGLETDGRKWHDRIKQAKRDKERDANAAREGVQILRILWEHVVCDPEGTWQLIMDTRAVRLKQLGRAL